MTRLARDGPDDARDRRVHRALASGVRTRMLEVLRGEPDLDVAALAERLDLHVNTVRTHLGVLEDAGLVAAVVEERDRPGRPRRLFRATPAAEAAPPLADDRGYRFLAGVLAGYLDATADDAAAAAEEAGAAWGRHVVESPAPFQRVAPTEAVDRLLELQREFGFEPRLLDTDTEQPRVLLRRCPFLDVAREHPDVVCSVHLGLLRGALAELEVDVTAQDLLPWARPDGCLASLRVTGT